MNLFAVDLRAALNNEKISRLFKHVGEFALGHRTLSHDSASRVAQRRSVSVNGFGNNQR